MPEDQTAWNSDNEGIKETFKQTGRKETGSRAGGEDRRQGFRDLAGGAGSEVP